MKDKHIFAVKKLDLKLLGRCLASILLEGRKGDIMLKPNNHIWNR